MRLVWIVPIVVGLAPGCVCSDNERPKPAANNPSSAPSGPPTVHGPLRLPKDHVVRLPANWTPPKIDLDAAELKEPDKAP
jgi:hypothetical protein